MKRVVFFHCRAIRGNWEKKEPNSEMREEFNLSKKPSNSESLTILMILCLMLTSYFSVRSGLMTLIWISWIFNSFLYRFFINIVFLFTPLPNYLLSSSLHHSNFPPLVAFDFEERSELSRTASSTSHPSFVISNSICNSSAEMMKAKR